uniref:Uncharacterized protein n=1 Tax=Megaselia scalaris TaxID=36166 RepID=T1GXA8_MEGSC
MDYGDSLRDLDFWGGGKYVFAEINRLLVEAINDFNVAADLSVWLALKIYELVEKRSRGGTLTNTRTGQMLIIMEFTLGLDKDWYRTG